MHSKAMIKCMLTSPTADSSNSCSLFSQSDFNGLSIAKTKAMISEANTWMTQASLYLAAYAHASVDEVKKAKLIDTLEVRMVMQVHSKKSPARTSFQSLSHIALEFYNEAKKLDSNLPLWSKLPSSLVNSAAVDSKSKKASAATASTRIREVSSCTVSDESLMERGFKVGGLLKNLKTNDIYEMTSMNSNLKTVTCKLKCDAEEAGKNAGIKKKKKNTTDEDTQVLDIDRFDLLDASTWSPYSELKPTFLTTYESPSSHLDFVQSIVAGRVKEVIAQDFSKSSEDFAILQLTPDCTLFAKKTFKGQNSFKLHPLTANIAVHPKVKTMDNSWQKIGKTLELPAGCKLQIGLNVYMKNSTVLPNKAGKDPFVSKFFLAKDTHDQSKTNCKFDMKEHTLKIMDFQVQLTIPYIINSKEIKEEAEIIVLKGSAPRVAEPSAPASKKRKR